jgi:hypothetical protein
MVVSETRYRESHVPTPTSHSVRKILGHHSVKVTVKTYAHLSPTAFEGDYTPQRGRAHRRPRHGDRHGG